MKRQRVRRGMSTTQWVVIAAVITLVIVAGITNLGGLTNTKLGQTASDVGNPQALTQRFGS